MSALPEPGDAGLVGDPYYIAASSLAADLPKLVLKHDDTFLVADRRGDFPDVPGGEFGFYVDGTRFLHQLELRVHGQRPLLLNAAVADDNLQVAVDLTNADIGAGEDLLLGRTLRLARRLTLAGPQLGVQLAIEAFTRAPHLLDLDWHFGADFADVFEVRGLTRARRGERRPPQRDGATVRLAYQGLDGVARVTHVTFDPAPDELTPGRARYRLTLPPGARAEVSVTVSATADDPRPPAVPGFGELVRRRREEERQRSARATRAVTATGRFNQWLDQARRDLHMLLTETAEGSVPYAGIPWFVAPFGRDSLLAALQMLPYEPDVARGTLRFLARHQGRTHDAFTEEAPGRILHEYRRGEMAACREIAFIPYYGSVDATPLFAMLTAEYLRWTGDHAFALELWPALERALHWMIGETGDGYLAYQCRAPLGLANQGWKDSHDAIMHASGDEAVAPIAVVEAQGYAYAALLGGAEVADALERPEPAAMLRARAEALRERFERDFWQDDLGFYALALDRDGAPCRVVTTNPGHCLWTGCVSPARAALVARHAMADDVFSGWGLRTLRVGERLFNPMSYHNGSVWPHDTAIVAAGLRRYGHRREFLRLATALFEAARHYEQMRLPELFCGFARVPDVGPTRYPVACSPQAWAAGVPFMLLGSMLGLAPDARANRLRLVDPVLPDWLDWVELRGLRVRDSRFDLRVSRTHDRASVDLLAREGDAELTVAPD